jgi:hypothetical protein
VGRVLRRIGLAAVVALALAPAALGAWPPPGEPAPGSFPASPRLHVPNDQDYDPCEPDDGSQTCASYFNEQYKLFGFQPETASLTPVVRTPVPYLDCSQLDAQGRDANVKAGDPACSQISGIRADSAWQYSTGDPNVVIAIFDNGIKWQEEELADQVRLNTGELPRPQGSAVYDRNGDGKVSVSDWAGQVAPTAGEDEADGLLDPSDLIGTFSDGSDADGNGYVDDIAGWDFFGDDNDPFDASDCCQNGHGTGRAEEAAAATNNGEGGAGVCPRCMVMPLRTSDSIVHDGNLIALATVYAADNGAGVTECSCGGLANSTFGRRAFTYADGKGVVQMMVSSDINSANHNYPTNYNEAIYVGGALPDTAPSENCEVPGLPGIGGGADVPGCAEFLDLFKGLTGVLPSSQFTTTSFFRNANLTQYGGKADIVLMGATGSEATGQAAGAAGLIAAYGRERLGSPLTGNEIRQLLTMTAEDVKPQNTGLIGQADKANPGWDPHFGYGRVNLAAAMASIQAGRIPPEVQIDAPDWFAPIDVREVQEGGLPVRARIATPHFDGGVSWELAYACGQDALDSEFQPLASGNGEVNGEIARLSKGLLGQLADSCDGSIANDAGLPAGTPAQTWPANPYPDPDPMRHAFQIRLTAREQADTDNVGRYRKTLFAYRDDGNHQGWPKPLGVLAEPGRLVSASGGEVSPRLYDLNGDNALDVVLGTTTGELFVFEASGRPLQSWNGGRPVTTRPYAQWSAHAGSAPGLGQVGPLGEALRTPAIGDVTGDGEPEVVATAGEHIYAWHRDGSRVRGFPQRIDPAFSHQCKGAAPRCFAPADRLLTRDNHVKRGFMASPALADLNEDGTLDIVGPSLDQRVYAWDGRGRDLPGFPVRIDSGDAADGGEIVASPTIADLDGDGDPEIVVATNELLDAEFPDSPNIDPNDLLGLFVQSATGTSATYALHGNGKPVDGWPVKTGALAGDLLPVVFPGEDAAAGDLAPRKGDEVAIFAGTGFVRLVGGDGRVIRGFASTPDADSRVSDTTPVLNLADYPSIGRLTDEQGPSLIKGGIGLAGAANLLATNQNLPFNHSVQAWDAATGEYRPGYPVATDDFQLLSQPAIAKVGGSGRQALVGTGLYQLHAYGAGGDEPSGWPKFTGGWLFATPSVGDIDGDGELDVTTATREGFAFAWRTGVDACGDGSPTNDEWWTFHHDEHGTARYGHDARPPGAPRALDRTRRGRTVRLSWRAPGDDWLCGDSARFRIVGGKGPIDGPDDGRVLESGNAGKQGALVSRSFELPAGVRRLGIVYRDEAGNWGHARDVSAALGCLPRRLGVSGRRIGPARLSRRTSGLKLRYRVRRERPRATSFCVRGGGRFLVASRRGRIDLVATTARRHRTRRTGPGRKLRGGRPRGARSIGRGYFVGHRHGGGRVVYGVSRRGRVRFLAVVTRKQTRKPRQLRRRLRRLGLRPRR